MRVYVVFALIAIAIFAVSVVVPRQRQQPLTAVPAASASIVNATTAGPLPPTATSAAPRVITSSAPNAALATGCAAIDSFFSTVIDPLERHAVPQSPFRAAMRRIIKDYNFGRGSSNAGAWCEVTQNPRFSANLKQLSRFSYVGMSSSIASVDDSGCSGFIIVQMRQESNRMFPASTGGGECRVPVQLAKNTVRNGNLSSADLASFDADNRLVQSWAGPAAFECDVFEGSAAGGAARRRACDAAIHDPGHCGRYLIPFDISDWCDDSSDTAAANFFTRQVWRDFDAVNDELPQVEISRYMRKDLPAQTAECSCRSTLKRAHRVSSYSWVTLGEIPKLSDSTNANASAALAAKAALALRRDLDSISNIQSNFAHTAGGGAGGTKIRWAPWRNIQLVLLRDGSGNNKQDQLSLPSSRVRWWVQTFPQLASDFAARRGANTFHALYLGDSQPRTMFRAHEAVIVNRPATKFKAFASSTLNVTRHLAGSKHIATFFLDNYLDRLCDLNESLVWFKLAPVPPVHVAHDKENRSSAVADYATGREFLSLPQYVAPSVVFLSIGPWPASVCTGPCYRFARFYEQMQRVKETIRIIQQMQKAQSMPVSRFVWLGPVAWPKPRKTLQGRSLPDFRVTNDRLRLFALLGGDVFSQQLSSSSSSPASEKLDIVSLGGGGLDRNGESPLKWTFGVMKSATKKDHMHYSVSALYEVMRHVFDLVLI